VVTEIAQTWRPFGRLDEAVPQHPEPEAALQLGGGHEDARAGALDDRDEVGVVLGQVDGGNRRVGEQPDAHVGAQHGEWVAHLVENNRSWWKLPDVRS